MLGREGGWRLGGRDVGVGIRRGGQVRMVTCGGKREGGKPLTEVDARRKEGKA